MNTKTTIDLNKFCASETSRYPNMRRPFTRGDFTYATNGDVVVRIPAVPSVGLNENAPAAEKLQWWDLVITNDQWLSIQDLESNLLGEEVTIGSKSISSLYLQLLQELPGILVAPDATPKKNAIPFKFDGGCGLLMPLNQF